MGRRAAMAATAALATLVGAACEDRGPVLPTPGAPPAPPPPSTVAASVGAAEPRPDLDALWRESVQYRSAHAALAGNAEGLAHDVDRSARMLETVGALGRLPIVPDAGADAAGLRAALLAYAKRLGLGAPDVTVTPPALEPLPPAEVDAAVGLRYEDAQVVAEHAVTVTLGQGLERGPRFMGELNALGRLLIVEGARIGPDGEAVLRARAPFFRALEPVRFVRRPPAWQAKLAALAPGSDAERERLEAIRANLAQVEALAAPLDEAFRHQAVLKISTARFRVYGALVERYNKASWAAALARGLP